MLMADVSRLQPTPSQIPSKGAKEEKLTLPLPVQIFAGQALGVIGQSLFSEKVIKPVSLLGYYGSRTVERTGQLLEGVIDFVINDTVAGLAADAAQTAVETRFTEAAENQALAATVAKNAVALAPLVGGVGVMGIDAADKVG
jgi:hypothetical protein